MKDLTLVIVICIFSHKNKMPITMAPPSIIFINTDLTDSIIETFTRQLFITEVMNAAMFDALVAADGYFPMMVHQLGWRIMVLRSLNDYTNRELADIVLFAKAGLVSVEKNKYGPPGTTLPIDKVYLTALYDLNRYPYCSPFPFWPWPPRPDYFPFGSTGGRRPNLADYMAWALGQEGIVNDRNFDPYVYYGTDPPFWLLNKGGIKSF